MNAFEGLSKVMRVILFCTVILGLVAVAPAFAGMQDDVDQAVNILRRFQSIPEREIPPSVMRQARGLAIMTVTKAGFIFSARGGTGIVVARTGKGWSPPSAIGTGGAGFGLQIGAEVTEFVIVLNTESAVKAFSQGGNVSLGAQLSVAAGPVGRTAEASVMPQAAVYTYSRSQGIFAGVSLQGTVIGSRDDTNAAYYGRPVTPSEILSGRVKTPKGARTLIKTLSRY